MWRNPFNNIGKFTDQFWKFHNFNNREIHVSFLIDLTKVDKEHWLTQGRTRQGNNRTCVRRRWALSTGQHWWRREKKDQPTYSCGHHQNQWMLRTPPSPPWPPTPQSPTLSSSPSLHLEDSHSLTHPHFSLTPSFHSTFHLAPQEPSTRWQTFLKPLTSEQSFSHFHLGHRLLPMSQDQRSEEANWSPRETESNWLPAAPTGVAVTRSFSEW